MKKALSREVQLLSEVASAFASSLDLESTLKAILRSLESHLSLQMGTINLLDPETEMLKVAVAHGISEEGKVRANTVLVKASQARSLRPATLMLFLIY